MYAQMTSISSGLTEVHHPKPISLRLFENTQALFRARRKTVLLEAEDLLIDEMKSYIDKQEDGMG